MSRRGEFDLIAQSLAPLSDAARGLGLTDDAALFEPAPGHTAVLSTDTLVAGVHFLPDDPPGDIARKALRVNLSDIAAMGAVPRGYLLNLSLPDDVADTWLDAFIAAWNIPPPGSDLARRWWVRSRELRALGTARGRHRPSASCVCCTECVRRSRRARSSAKALATPRGPHGRAWQGKQLRPTLALYLIVNRWRRMDVGES